MRVTFSYPVVGFCSVSQNTFYLVQGCNELRQCGLENVCNKGVIHSWNHSLVPFLKAFLPLLTSKVTSSSERASSTWQFSFEVGSFRFYREFIKTIIDTVCSVLGKNIVSHAAILYTLICSSIE